MRKQVTILLTTLLVVACNEEPGTRLTAAQQVQNRLAIQNTQAVKAPDEFLNQHMQQTSGLAPIHQAGDIFAQQAQNLAAPLGQILQEGWGTELESVDTSFNGQRVTYQYQIWKVKPKSVCSHAQHQITQFSACTFAAKDLFHALCRTLQRKKNGPDYRIRKLHNMYCQAAVSFRPTIAQISRSQPLSKKGHAVRKKCNDSIILDMISGENKEKKPRNEACNALERLLHQKNNG